MKIQLSLFVQDHQRDWDKYVTLLLMVYRTAIHNPMKLSPARLMMGHEIRTPIELIDGRPDYETRETYSCNAQGLQKNLERAHEFARTNLNSATKELKPVTMLTAQQTCLIKESWFGFTILAGERVGASN